MQNLLNDFSKIILILGILAFLVSVITEVLKKVEWLDNLMPTPLLVIILSVIICPLTILGLLHYLGQPIEWFMAFASFIAAFIVALVSMDGWERVTELAEKLIKR